MPLAVVGFAEASLELLLDTGKSRHVRRCVCLGWSILENANRE